MDNNLLEALQNIGSWLERLSIILDDKKESKSTIASSLSSGNFSQSLIEISNDLKDLKSDNKKILNNQETIIQLQRENQKDTSFFGKVSKDLPQLTEGIAVIGLLAGAIMAMGLAFNVVGDVDIGTVIALSSAILILSIAFKNIAGLGINIKDGVNASLTIMMLSGSLLASSWLLSKVSIVTTEQYLTILGIATAFSIISLTIDKLALGAITFKMMGISMVHLSTMMIGISTAITGSSYILQYIRPISFTQMITTMAIAATFAIVSMNLEKIGLGVALLSKTGVTPIQLGLALVGISSAITASSWILSMVSPISIPQALTAIGIAAAFAIISMNMDKLALGVLAFNKTGVTVTDLVKTLVGVASAITLSSWIFSLVTPVTIGQGLTVIVIGALFAGLSYVMPEMATGLAIMNKLVKPDDYLLIPKLYVAIATAITISSWVLSMAVPLSFSQGLGIIFAAATIVATAIPIGLTSIFLSKIGSPLDYIKGGVAILLISSIIVGSSHILGMGNYEKYPPLNWALGVGISLAGFGVGALLLGTLVFGPQGLLFAAGLGSILLVSSVIVAASHILSRGVYDILPSTNWSLSLVALLGGFALLSIPLGLASPFILMGSIASIAIAGTIVGIDKILTIGKYEKYPNEEWSMGVSTLLGKTALMLSGMSLLLPFILGGSLSALMTAGTIIGLDKILSIGDYTSYPNEEWSMGVTTLLGKTALTLSGMSLLSPFIFLGSISAVMTSGAIVSIDKILSTGKYEKYPNEEWSMGVSTLLGKTALMLSGMSLLSPFIFLGSISAVMTSRTIASIDRIFSLGAFKKYPSVDWSDNVINIIGKFVKLSTGISLLDVIGNKLKNLFGGGIDGIADSIVRVDRIFSLGAFNKYPSVDWSDNVINIIGKFVKLSTEISLLGVIGNKLKNLFGGGIDGIADSIVRVDNIFSTGDFRIYPNQEWVLGVYDSIYKLSGLRGILSNDVLLNSYKIIEIDDILSRGNYSITLGKWISDLAESLNKLSKLGQLDIPNIGKSIMGLEASVQKPFNAIALENTIIRLGLLGDSLSKLSDSMDDFNKSLSLLDSDKLNVLRSLSSNIVLMSMMDPTQYDKVMNALEKKSEVFNGLAVQLEQQKKVGMSDVKSSSITVSTSNNEKDNFEELGKKMDNIAYLLSDISSDLKSYLINIREKQLS